MPEEEGKLSIWTRLAYGSGDFYGGASITIVNMLFLFYLTSIVSMRPVLAGTVVFIGRLVDAVTDPWMGVISDRTRSRWGRRRPYFLFFSVPVGLSFVTLWLNPEFGSEAFTFIYYSLAYVFFSIVFTAVMVPYGALAPELTANYHERTALISTRMAFSIIGALCAAVAPKMIVDAHGGGPPGYLVMSAVFGGIFIFPWLLQFFAMRGKERFKDQTRFRSVGASLAACFKNRSFRSLIGIYLFSFIPIDVLSTSFIFFLTFYMGREELFSPVMGVLLVCTMLSLPLYVALSRRRGKRDTYLIGSVFWMAVLALLFLIPPGAPVWVILAVAVLVGAGMGVAYALPWSMLPEVVDVDEALTGMRQEGLYTGLMTFVRKVSSSLAVFLIGAVLELAGFTASGPQPSSAVTAIRLVTVAVPIILLACGCYFGWKFPITPDRFARIQKWLELKRQNSLHRLDPGELAGLARAVEEAGGSKYTGGDVSDAPSA